MEKDRNLYKPQLEQSALAIPHAPLDNEQDEVKNYYANFQHLLIKEQEVIKNQLPPQDILVSEQYPSYIPGCLIDFDTIKQ